MCLEAEICKDRIQREIFSESKINTKSSMTKWMLTCGIMVVTDNVRIEATHMQRKEATIMHEDNGMILI